MLRDYLELPRAVHVLCLGTFINRAGSFLLVFLTLYLKGELGFDAEVATRAMGAFGLGSIGACLVGGQLADTIGRRTVMLISLVGGAIVLMIFSSLRSWWAITLATFVFAAVMEMYRPAASAMIADLVEPQRRAHAFGLMYVAINLGFSFAPVIGGFVAGYSFQWLFWGDALTTLIYAAVIFFAIRETLARRPASPVSVAPEPSTNSRPADRDDVSIADAARHILADTTFLVFCVASLVVAMIYQQAFTTFPIHLTSFGIGPEVYGRIIALNGMMIVVLQLPMTAMLKRFNRASVLTAATLVIAAGIGMIDLAVSAWGFAFTVVVWTFGEMMDAPVRFAIAADLAPVELRARYMGVMNMSFAAALAIGAPMGGIVLSRLGSSPLWGICFVLGFAAFGMCLSIHRRLTLAQASTGGDT